MVYATRTSQALTGSPNVEEELNQSPPLTNYNLFENDLALVEALSREGGEGSEETVSAFGHLMGSQELIDAGFDANRNHPELHTHDRFGTRIDEVRFHPAWHTLMRASVEYGLHNLSWDADISNGHTVRAALMILASQNETGHLCPISMTNSVVPVLREHAGIAAYWVPKIASTQYDPRFVPSDQKHSVLVGMALTERQGGSDVRANTSIAESTGTDGSLQTFLITGHKWFCSAPMCDAFLVLAQTESGLGCFFLPRWRPDGSQNRLHIQRLKDKLGNCSNASAEIEFYGAYAVLIGDEGRGVSTIAAMINLTRLDCILASTGFMRQGLTQALHHASHRNAFGARLIEHPLMKNVLTDLCLESEASTILAMRIGRAYDEAQTSESAENFSRVTTAIAKYWICKRAPFHVFEAMECIGGNAYVEESVLPRIYRESPLPSIWEGCGNINVLDARRAAGAQPQSLEYLLDEIKLAKGENRYLDKAIAGLEKDENPLGVDELEGRTKVERLVLALQASLLVRHSTDSVADAFCASRLDGQWGHVFGTLPKSINYNEVLERGLQQH